MYDVVLEEQLQLQDRVSGGMGVGAVNSLTAAVRTPCVCKVVELAASDCFKAESYHVEASFYSHGACAWLTQALDSGGRHGYRNSTDRSGRDRSSEKEDEEENEEDEKGRACGTGSPGCGDRGSRNGNGGGGEARKRTRRTLMVPTVLAIEREPPLSSPGTRAHNGALFCFLMSDLRVTHPLHPRALDLTQVCKQ